MDKEPLAVRGLVGGPDRHARIVAAQELDAVAAGLVEACSAGLTAEVRKLIDEALNNAVTRGYHLGQAEQAAGLVLTGVDVQFDVDWSQALEIVEGR